MIFYTVGRILELEAVLLALPALVSLIYLEKCGWSFLATLALAALLGLGLSRLCRTDNVRIYAREGFAIVALSWVLMSAVGALPFVLCGEIPNYIDAFFETVSGFTTTGATILTNVEVLSHGTAFWRSFTHWIGGMGVLTLIMAIIPNLSDRSIHIMRAEMPGPVIGKLVPKVKDTAKILYILYIALTALETILLLCGGMPVFDSFVHALGTAGTGGFGIRADSIASYSPYLQWVITAFMFLFGINFNLYYLIVIRRFSTAIKSRELWLYTAIVLVVGSVITFDLTRNEIFPAVSDAIRAAFFQTSSYLTTTGYGTADVNSWPMLSQGLLFILMFLGGCAGSTAGGLKLSRAMMLVKQIGRELRHMIHPRSVSTVRMEGKAVDEQTMNSVSTYFAFYIVCIGATFVLLCLDPNVAGFKENVTASVSCFNNIGPVFGNAGAGGSYTDYSGFSKIVLSLAMLFGRLEIYPMMLALIPTTWTKK